MNDLDKFLFSIRRAGRVTKEELLSLLSSEDDDCILICYDSDGVELRLTAAEYCSDDAVILHFEEVKDRR